MSSHIQRDVTQCMPSSIYIPTPTRILCITHPFQEGVVVLDDEVGLQARQDTDLSYALFLLLQYRMTRVHETMSGVAHTYVTHAYADLR